MHHNESDLTTKNYEMFAARHYKPYGKCVDVDEFYEDLERFSYVLRLLRRHKETGSLNVRLVLNHIITIYNVFEISAATKMIRFKLDDDLHPVLNTFLVFLNYLSEQERDRATIDLTIAKELQEI